MRFPAGVWLLWAAPTVAFAPSSRNGLAHPPLVAAASRPHRRLDLAAEPSGAPSGAEALKAPDLTFVLHSPCDEPSEDELSNENIGCIVWDLCTDEQVNALVWKCLGYRRATGSDGDGGAWDTAEVFPKWRVRFPAPPDLVGVTRIYSKEVDEPVLRANQALHRSIPMAHKDGLRDELRQPPVNFFGFKLAGLTPNKTRRAQCANWLIYYRVALWRRSLDELIAARDRDVEAENRAAILRGESLRVATASGNGAAAAPAAASAAAAADDGAATSGASDA